MQITLGRDRLLDPLCWARVSRWVAILLFWSLCLVSHECSARPRKPSPSRQLSQLLDEVYGSGLNPTPWPGPTIEDYKAAQRLIYAGARVNTRGKVHRVTTLMLAVSFGDANFVRYLLSRGSRLDLISGFGGDALEQAISCASLECVELLLKHGASTKTWYRTAIPMTPLMLASDIVDREERTAEKRDAVIKALLRHGADARVVSKDGYTVLHLQCAVRPRLSAVRLLLEAGADVNQATSDGVTPLEQCESIGAAEVAEVLKQWGARRSSSSPSRSE